MFKPGDTLLYWEPAPYKEIETHVFVRGIANTGGFEYITTDKCSLRPAMYFFPLSARETLEKVKMAYEEAKKAENLATAKFYELRNVIARGEYPNG